MRFQRPPCYACEDESTGEHDGRPVCRDCLRELRLGEIEPPGNVEFFFARDLDPFLSDRLYQGRRIETLGRLLRRGQEMIDMD